MNIGPSKRLKANYPGEDIKDNELKLNELFLGFDGWVSMPKSDIDMDIKFNAKKTEFKNFLSLVPGIYSKDFEKMETKGTLALDGFAKGTYNDKKMPAYAINILIENAMFKYPGLPKAVTNIALKANISCKDGNTDSCCKNKQICFFGKWRYAGNCRTPQWWPFGGPGRWTNFGPRSKSYLHFGCQARDWFIG